MNKVYKTFLIFLCTIPLTVVAESYVVGQKNKKFSEDKLTINVGDVINFQNNDNFFHNIFSLSDVQAFDLGSYPKGESREVIFEKIGTLVIECAIHPSMSLEVTVRK